MKNSILLITIISIMASCGGKDKKAELEGLLKQQAELSKKIDALQSELSKEGKDSSAPKKINLVEATPITPVIFSSYIDVQGKVDADENVSLSSEMPGTITRINVKPGDEVSKGQVLAETDARAIQQSMSSLQTNLDLVTQIYEKQKNLWEQKIGTEVQFLQSKSNKESLEKQMATLQEQIRMSKIISPINGTVDAVDIKVGQAVAPGIPAIRVINFSNLKVKADLAESYAGRVKKGDAVKVYFPDNNDSLQSKVNYAARAINNMSRTFTIEVLLDNKKEYHPNMVTKLKINDYNSPAPVIVIPVRVIQTSAAGEKFVYVANGAITEKRLIKTGREYDGKIEIVSGLKQGELLITSGYDNINEGDALTYKK
ncbi:MAG: efflux RND transporter periplasmic adaptor subunit [Bacteroidia bacterium]